MTTGDEQTSAFDPLDEAIAEYLQLHESGAAPPRAEFLARHPALAERLREFFADFDRVGRDASKFRLPNSDATQSYGTSACADLPTVRYLGDYELLEEIARGGMGVVYKARQVSLNRTVALKMILAGTYATPQAVQRFRAEAEAAANVDHPNILPIYEVGEHDGHQYFSMKLIPGGSLAEHRARLIGHRKAIAKLVETLSRGVHYAHQRGILHRDLKPANILIDADGTPVITDFGLAKRVDSDSAATLSGSIVGTPSYMPPEQARGAKDIATSADVYSLGAILYELLTGQPPFKGETIAQTLRMVEEQEPSPPRNLNRTIDRDLSQIAMKCLEKSPAKRYPSAEELANDLARWQRGEPVTARRAGLVRRTRKWLVRNPLSTAIMVVATIAAGLVSVALLKTRTALQAAQWQSYVSLLVLASREAIDHQNDAANVLLNRTVPEMRGWEYHHVHRLANPEAAIWDPWLGSMLALDGSDDGQVIVASTLSSRGAVAARLNPETGKVAAEYIAPAGTAFPVLFKIFISVSRDGNWVAVSNGTKVLTFQANGAYASTLAWTEEESLTGIAFDANGTRLAVITKNNHLQVWDRTTQKKLFDVAHKNTQSHCPAWRNDRELVIIADDALRSYSAQDSKPILTLPMKDFDKHLPDGQGILDELVFRESVALSRDGRWAALGGIGHILLADLADGKVVRKLVGESEIREPVRKYVNVSAMRFAPDGKHLVACSQTDRAVRIWQLDQPGMRVPVAVHYGHPPNPTGIAFLPGGRRVLTTGNDVLGRIWELPPREYPREILERTFTEKSQTWNRGEFTAMAVSADGKHLAVADAIGGVAVIDTRTEKPVWNTRLDSRVILQLAFSPDGTKLGVGAGWHNSRANSHGNLNPENRDGVVLNVRDGSTLYRLSPAPGDYSAISSVIFSSDGTSVFTASGSSDAGNDLVRKWSASDGSFIANLDTENDGTSNTGRRVSGIACDPTRAGEIAVAPEYNGATHISSSIDGSMKHSLDINHKSGTAYFVEYSRDGRYLVTHRQDRLTVWERATARRWDKPLTAGPQLLADLEKLPPILQLAISPDGERLALACREHLILRATRTGDELIRIPVPGGGCETVAWHPDGKILYVGSRTGVLCYEP